MKHLILGGARSGKSRYAEQQALASAQKNNQNLRYVATATGDDDEMAARINMHQSRRDNNWHSSEWTLIEESINVVSVIETYSLREDCLLIDCLTLWLSNILIEDKQKYDWPQIKQAFLQSLALSKASIFMVSNEVGSGIVPMGELSRQFVDESGWLHQDIAMVCEQVTLVTAGLPLTLKGKH
ncbi:MAG: adenosylcobinamide kinase/adenosylcobinamide-phosphate guanylyltransferase [Cellvibrionaceae bacterium]|jgi:adenosylcobinamide kinase/adenosylcobinamide-phosphate guanylyltransferase